MPLLDAVQVRYCPADGARPDAGSSHNLARADDAFVLPVVDVLVDPGR